MSPPSTPTRRGLIRSLAVVLAVLAVPTAATAEPDPGPATDRIVGGDDRLATGITDDDLWDGRLDGTSRVAGSTSTDDLLERTVPLASQRVARGVEFTGDPLGLAVYPLESRRYTDGNDPIGVYLCTSSKGASGLVDLDEAVATLNGPVRTWYATASRGEYQPVFRARRTVTIDAPPVDNHRFDCADAVLRVAVDQGLDADAGALILADNAQNGGVATPGELCGLPCGGAADAPTRFPANRRWGVIDGGSVTAVGGTDPHLTTAVHELGHMIGWPHSNSGRSEYDNPIDVMSANREPGAPRRSDDPYGTVAWNRYRAGWIDPGQVVVYRGGVRTIRIAPAGEPGTQMVALPSGSPYAFLTLDARRATGYDADLPDRLQGVTAHYIQQLGGCDPTGQAAVCWGTESDVRTYPPAPGSLRHVTRPGSSVWLDVDQGVELVAHGTKLTVVGGDDTGYTIRLVGFADTGRSIFHGDIVWLAEHAITRGCADTRFCPDDEVTRGQMAAFLVRALHLTERGDIDYTDDNDSIFEADIEKLATAGITKGCGGPGENRFCPDDEVTRGQMAAFIRRGLTRTG